MFRASNSSFLAEHQAAHDRIIDVKDFRQLRVRLKDHGAYQTVVTIFVYELEDPKLLFVVRKRITNFLRRVSPCGCRIELISFVE